MKQFHQEVLRVILLNARYRRVTSVEISKGTINECVAHPREIFRPAIIHCAYAFVSYPQSSLGGIHRRATPICA